MATKTKKTVIEKRVDTLLRVQDQTALERGDVGYMARALVLATLPHKKTTEAFYKRSNGNFHLELSQNTAKVGLPYGSVPRLLLAFMATQAVKTQSPEINLGDNLSQFLAALGLSRTGGRWGNITRVKDQMRRLAFCSMNLSRVEVDENGTTETFKNLQIARSGSFHWAKDPNQKDLWDSTVVLSDDFYLEIINHPVPLDMAILSALKQSPLALDIYSWLTYRTSYQKGRSKPIPWDSLQAQFGADYPKTARGKADFKRKFKAKLKEVTKLYTGANVDADADNGLVISAGQTSVPKVAKKK